MFYRPKFKKIIFVLSFALLLGGFVYAQEDVILDARYLDGPLAGQEPSSGLDAQANIALVAGFEGSDELCQTGALPYRLFRTMAHAKNGDLKQVEYLAKGEGDKMELEFNSGPSGQKNIYWPIFYCWSSNVPEVALGTAKQWTSQEKFDQDTVGGRCNLSNARWSSTSVKVGDSVNLSVDGTLGCKGRPFKFELWRGGTALFSRIETTIDAIFPSAGDGPYTVSKTWKVTSDNKYIFKARMPDPNGALAVSAEISLSAGGGTEDKTVSLEFKNPLAANDLRELVDALLSWIFWLSIPTAVIIIIYAGIVMAGSGGNPEKFGHGRKILLWAVVGLAVIFIGRGVIALIESILKLGK